MSYPQEILLTEYRLTESAHQSAYVRITDLYANDAALFHQISVTSKGIVGVVSSLAILEARVSSIRALMTDKKASLSKQQITKSVRDGLYDQIDFSLLNSEGFNDQLLGFVEDMLDTRRLISSKDNYTNLKDTIQEFYYHPSVTPKYIASAIVYLTQEAVAIYAHAVEQTDPQLAIAEYYVAYSYIDVAGHLVGRMKDFTDTHAQKQVSKGMAKYLKKMRRVIPDKKLPKKDKRKKHIKELSLTAFLLKKSAKKLQNA